MTFKRYKYFIVIISLCLLSIFNMLSNIYSKDISEYELKAALLLKFPAFIEWPSEKFSSDSNNFIIYILGDDPFGNIFQSFSNEKIKNKNFIIKNADDVKQIGVCHLLFICDSKKEELKEILDYLKTKQILSVGESENFNELGGIINFCYGSKGNIVFEINQEAGMRAGLKISSKLLGIAKQ